MVRGFFVWIEQKTAKSESNSRAEGSVPTTKEVKLFELLLLKNLKVKCIYIGHIVNIKNTVLGRL